jgi:hypothetical protein
LIPDHREPAFAGNGFEQEQTVGGETEGRFCRRWKDVTKAKTKEDEEQKAT